MTSSLDESMLRAAAERYARDGFYLSPQIIEPDLIRRVSAALDEQASAEPFRSLPPTTLRKMDGAQIHFPAVHELCSHPVIGRLAAALTDASMIQCFVTQELIKPPGGTETANVGWHQDYQYWQEMVRGDLLTAWVALSDVTEDAGPMRFVVGSHKWGLLNAGDFFSGNLDALRTRIEAAHPGEHWQEASAVLKPGAVSFHHRLTIHGSGPNRSAGDRKSVAIHLRTEKSALAEGVKFGDVGWLNDFADQRACPVLYGQLPGSGGL
jgi:hypothetical protein